MMEGHWGLCSEVKGVPLEGLGSGSSLSRAAPSHVWHSQCIQPRDAEQAVAWPRTLK